MRAYEKNMQSLLDRFANRYKQVVNAGCCVSIPDNPMGKPRYSCLECFDAIGISPDPDKVLMNLNTFHSKDELDKLLENAANLGLRNLLIVRGDGGPQLPRLDPLSVGGKYNIATTMDLLCYIDHQYGDQFITGAAFNPYNKMPFELERAKQKLEAGASFMITQPIIGRDIHVDSLLSLSENVVVEAWMSEKVDLFYKSIGRVVLDEDESYDPVNNLVALHEAYPDSPVYLSMLNFEHGWQGLLPALST